MKSIIFGDVHLQSDSERVILDYARKYEINKLYTLGDEGHKIYPFASGTQEENDAVFDHIRDFLQEDNSRSLTAVLGDKTYYIPKDFVKHFQGVADNYEREGSVIYRRENIIAGHIGSDILDEYESLIKNWNDEENPLVIFHGHSHSMGVLDDYIWLKDNEFVFYLDEDETHQLMPWRSILG